MPNHCENQITITGPKDKIDLFWANLHKGENGEPSFSIMMPMPEILKGCRAFDTHNGTGDIPEETLTRWKGWVADSDNTLWTQEYYDTQVQEWHDAYERSLIAKQETGFSGWYSWAISDENWGTKWGDYETHVWRDNPQTWETDLDYKIGATYDTAWSPFSNKFWETISDRYYGVSFVVSYREEGMCFEGSQTYFNGECLHDECIEITTHQATAVFEAENARERYAEELAEIKK